MGQGFDPALSGSNQASLGKGKPMFNLPTEPARRLDNGKPDDRYQLSFEFLGYSVSQLALRFCGELIGAPNGIMAARRIAEDHYAKMMGEYA